MKFSLFSTAALAVASDVDDEALNLLQMKVNLNLESDTNTTVNLCCPRGYEQMGNIGADVRGWGLVGRGNRASSLGDCKAQCDRDYRCGSFEYNKEQGECALNDWGNSHDGAQNGRWGWALTCKRPYTATSCPAGYKQMGNIGDDVRGWGLVRWGNRASSLGDCQAQCDRDYRCGSFEYNKEKGECALNDWANSNAGAQNGKWGSAITCKRASCIPPTTTTTRTTTTTVKMFVPCPAQGQQNSDECPAGCEHVTNCAECALAAKVWASKGFSYSSAPFKAGAVRPTGCFRNRKNLVKCNKNNPKGGAKGKWPICKKIQ